MHLASQIVEQLNSARELNNKWDSYIIQNIRLAGLLHDIGHGPFSHTFDQFLKRASINHEHIGCHILRNHGELTSILENEDRINDISYIAWGKQVLTKAGIDKIIVRKLHERKEMRLFSDIIHGPPHCADILDFLVRDAKHAGVIYGQVDTGRLLAYMDIFEDKLGIEDKAFDAYESMILARYYMFKTIYFHRSSRAMELLLLEALTKIDRLLQKKNGKGFLDVVQGIKNRDIEDINRYMDFDDYFVYTMIRCNKKQELELQELADNIFHRKLPKRIYARREMEFEEKMQSLNVTMDVLVNLWKKKIVEKARERKIEISEEDIFVDIPSLTTIPLHARAVTIEDLKEYLFTVDEGTKQAFEPKASIIEKMSTKEHQIQIYVRQMSKEDRKLLESICEELWAETTPQQISTQA